MAIANIGQQVSGLILFLSVPNLLTVDQYASVVAMTTAISFLGFSDLGLGNAYSRDLVGLEAANDFSKIIALDKAIFWGKIYLSSILGCIFTTVFYFYGHSFFDSISLTILAVVLTLVQMLAAKFASQEQFSLSKALITIQSLMRLFQIPLAWAYGYEGWLLGFMLSACSPVLIKDVRIILKKIIFCKTCVDFEIIKSKFRPGIQLGLITLAWAQLLNVGRLIASTSYPDDVIAAYGVVSGLYQVAASFIISISVPQTVKLYKIYETNARNSFIYAVDSAWRLSLLAFFLASTIVILFSLLANDLFPAINIDFWVLFFTVSSLFLYPAVVTLGAYLVAARRYLPYLSIIIFGLIISYVIGAVGYGSFGFRAGSIAQFFSIFVYVLILIVYTRLLGFNND